MTKTGHQLTGVGAGLAAIGWIGWAFPGSNLLWLAVLAFFGSSAPDWLELPLGWQGRQRLSVIPHRTWTHWWPVWGLVTCYGAGLFTSHPCPSILAFVTGGWLHLILDLPNPMGLPLWTPWRRVSLRWWTSSEHVPGLALASWVVGGLVLLLPGLVQAFGLPL